MSKKKSVPLKKSKPVMKVMSSDSPQVDDLHLMIDFTAMQLKLCYDRLVNYPQIQEEIVELIKKLAKI